MKNIVKMAALLCALLPAVSACGKDNPKDPETPSVTAGNYDVLGLGEVAIGLWVTPPPAYQTSAHYADIRACGINFVNGFMYNDTDIKKILDMCEANDLKYFASKASVAENIKAYASQKNDALLKTFINGIKPYASHPAFAGELLMDEPGKPLFDAIADFTGLYERTYKNKLWHVNLFPTYATGGIQAPSYEDYINTWMTTIEPKLMSYDSYPLLTDGKIISDYFYNLDFIRAKTAFKKIPFWTFIQTLSIAGTPGVPDKRQPSENDIRWQVWTNLAFGAKGLQYFCYWSPGNGSEQFGNALIDLQGNKTESYGWVKTLNTDIREIGKILLGCNADGVIMNSQTAYKMHSPLYEFAAIGAVSGDECNVGCFTGADGGKKALVVPLLPQNAAKVTLKLSEADMNVRIWTGVNAETKKITGTSLVLDIPAGGAVFVEFL